MKLEIFSKRQLEVMHLLCDGKTVVEIAAILGISSRMVDVHIRSAQKKILARTREQAVFKFAQLLNLAS